MRSCFLLFCISCLLFSCTQEKSPQQNLEALVTQRSDTLLMISYEDGAKTYRFYTPLMERYEFAREPYQEFSRGVLIENFEHDTLLSSSLRADYAIFYERLELWEAKGNVVGTNADGMVMETQQLFWDQRSDRIYSNVDTKVTQPTGDVIVGQGFESDQDFDNLVYRRPRGQITIDTQPTAPTETPADTSAVESAATAASVEPVEAVPAASPDSRRNLRQLDDGRRIIRVEEN